jgi:hypothetical protein
MIGIIACDDWYYCIVYNIYFQEAIFTRNFQGEFEGLDIISNEVSLEKSKDRDFTVKDFFKDYKGSLFIQPDQANNRVIFHVMKKLNLIQTSKRHIVIDLRKKVLRNETIHGVVCVNVYVCVRALACMVVCVCVCVCMCVCVCGNAETRHTLCTDARCTDALACLHTNRHTHTDNLSFSIDQPHIQTHTHNQAACASSFRLNKSGWCKMILKMIAKSLSSS